MNCGICNKKVRKDVKIEDIQMCHKCKNVWLHNFNKIHNMKVKLMTPYKK